MPRAEIEILAPRLLAAEFCFYSFRTSYSRLTGGLLLADRRGRAVPRVVFSSFFQRSVEVREHADAAHLRDLPTERAADVVV